MTCPVSSLGLDDQGHPWGLEHATELEAVKWPLEAGRPVLYRMLILIVGIAVAVFVILFFGAVLMLYGGA